MVRMDKIDVGILEILVKDSSARPNQISSPRPSRKNIIQTPRSVLNRIERSMELYKVTR
jgi:hypothetical protein